MKLKSLKFHRKYWYVDVYEIKINEIPNDLLTFWRIWNRNPWKSYGNIKLFDVYEISINEVLNDLLHFDVYEIEIVEIPMEILIFWCVWNLNQWNS